MNATFCGSTGPFWDPDLLKSPTLPRISECLQHSVLVLIPTCFTLFLAAPLLAFQLTRKSESKPQPLPWTAFLSAKYVITCFLVADTLFLFLLAIIDYIVWDELNPVNFVYPLILCASMLFTLFFVNACRRRGKDTSGPMFLVWIMFAFCGLPELYHWILTATDPSEMDRHRVMRCAAFLIWYPCVLTQAVLFAFADTPARNSISQRGDLEANHEMGQREEQQIRKEFLQSTASKEASFFCYLLIDPTRLPSDASKVTFSRFLSAIFYVGKGKGRRPQQHLVDAIIAKQKGVERSEKEKRILDLWNRGQGVISLEIFHNVHAAGALVREGAMIDAIGLENLTNVRRGTFTGVASNWSRQQIAEFGDLLLHKAHTIFQNEPCPPIFEQNVKAEKDLWRWNKKN